MPPFYKKRRRSGPGPNKNELKVRRRNEADNPNAGRRPLSAEFPGVEQMTLQMEFLTPQGQILDEQKRVFEADDFPELLVECMGRCGGEGVFDLSEPIHRGVADRNTHPLSALVCAHRLYPGAPDTCGAQLRTRIDLRFA